ncbi:MAG: hypothetical protein ACKVPX_05005 [Myxococcaceae bacterium]
MRDIFRFSMVVTLGATLVACELRETGGGDNLKWTHAIGSGRDLYVVTVDEDGVSFEDSVSLPNDGATTYLGGHAIFGMAQHPTEPWLYATSLNECSSTGPWCWGNGRIDRFEITGRGLEPMGAAYLYVPQSGPVSSCVNSVSGNPGQIGECAPVSITFTPDGTRAFVQDDWDDAIHTFNVNEDGTLEFVAVQGDTGQHGLAVHPNGDYLYHGSRTYSIAGNSPPVEIFSGITGNATHVLYGGTRLLTTTSTNRVRYYSIVNPWAPTQIANRNQGGDRARDIAVNSTETRAVVVGQNWVRTMPLSSSDVTDGPSELLPDNPEREHRSVAFGFNDTRFVVGWFRTTTPIEGGVSLYGIDEFGNFGQLDQIDMPGSVRMVHQVRCSGGVSCDAAQ